MQLSEFRHIVSRFTYKPGYEFIVQSFTEDRMATLVLRYRAPDARDQRSPPRVVDLVLRQAVDIADRRHGSDPVEYVISAIESMIEKAELHESQEWLKFDGKIIRDPHA